MDPRNKTIVREALARIDVQGRFLAGDVPGLRRVVDELGVVPLAIDHPAGLFGPWEELGHNAGVAFRRMVEDEISGTMRLFPRGDLWNGWIRGCWEADRYMAESRVCPRARGPLITFANRLTAGPMNLRNRLSPRSRRRGWHSGTDLSLAAFLAAAGRGPSWLLGDFVEGVSVDPQARGYYFDRARNVAFGYHIGLDLMPTAEGMICLEANLQVGIGDLRPPLQPENPTANGILEAALAHRARRVVWVEGNRVPLRPWVVQQLTERARALGIHVEFLEDPRMPRRKEVPSDMGIPNRGSWVDWVPDNTLVVRRNEFPVGSDFVINDKEPLIRALHAVLRETGESRVKVLPQSRVPVNLSEPAGKGLPNLVYKYPDSLAGQGVFFLKVRDTAQALALARELDTRTGEGPGLFQRFVRSELMPGGRVYDFRAEIFLSPLGTWFLGALRREASVSPPVHLPEGVVDAPGALTSNFSTGGKITKVDGDELKRVGEAAVAVGNALRTALDRTFRTGPNRLPGPVPA